MNVAKTRPQVGFGPSSCISLPENSVGTRTSKSNGFFSFSHNILYIYIYTLYILYTHYIYVHYIYGVHPPFSGIPDIS